MAKTWKRVEKRTNFLASPEQEMRPEPHVQVLMSGLVLRLCNFYFSDDVCKRGRQDDLPLPYLVALC